MRPESWPSQAPFSDVETEARELERLSKSISPLITKWPDCHLITG